jgi:predicted transcriptional regulator
MSNETLILITAMLCSLQETGGTPESMLYILCEMDINKWHSIRELMIMADLIKISGNYVTLTKKGSDTATKMNAALRAEKPAQANAR